jgi:hypothetical protein
VKDQNGRAVDCFRQVPATGAGGGAPLAPFPTFSGPPCQDAPDLHNPPPVPHPAPATPPAPSAPSTPSAPSSAPAAPAGGADQPVAGSVAQSARCVVPRLKGRSVARVRRMLAGSKCRLGLVLRPRHAHGRLVVSSQRPRAGTRRPTGTRVAVRLRVKR